MFRFFPVVIDEMRGIVEAMKLRGYQKPWLHPIHTAEYIVVQFKENMGFMPEIIKEIEAFFTENKPDIVLADFIAVPVGFVCRKFNIPWITSIPTPFAIENKTTT